jgi:DNA/RNA endonuclease YhcR with UshA esterase domain
LREDLLTKICFFSAIIGIVSLYLISFTLVAEDLDLDSLNANLVGKKVTLSGSVDDVRNHKNGHIFFKMRNNTNSIEVVLWESKVEQLRLNGYDLSMISEGNRLQITGTLEMYKGNIQLVV